MKIAFGQVSSSCSLNLTGEVKFMIFPSKYYKSENIKIGKYHKSVNIIN